jgi:thiosulfate sulfurtransferase
MSSPEIPEITADQAMKRLEADDAAFIDVRDTASYRRGHVPGARHIGDHNVEDFIRDTERDTAVIVYCYHGNSSLGGAAYLEENGFTEVYSMTGGFASWEGRPTETSPEPERPRAPSGSSTEVKQAQHSRPETQRNSKRQRLGLAAKALARRLLR